MATASAVLTVDEQHDPEGDLMWALTLAGTTYSAAQRDALVSALEGIGVRVVWNHDGFSRAV